MWQLTGLAFVIASTLSWDVCSGHILSQDAPRTVSGRRLVAATGLVVKPTPGKGAANNSRFNGPLNPDPERRPLVQGLYEVLAQDSDVVAVHLIHVPGTDKYLYMERPSDKRSITRQIAGTFNLVTRKWTPVDAVDGLFCSGHTVSSEGAVVVVGGHKATGGYNDGMRSVRVFDHMTNPTRLVNATWMEWKRWYPTPTLLPDGKIMIMGGTQQVGGSSGGNLQYEIYDVNNNPNQYPLPYKAAEASFVRQSKKMFYPFNFVLPTGDVYSFSERQGRIMVPETGVYRQNADGSYMMGDRLTGTDFTQFPFTASGVFSALTPTNNYSSIDLMIFGGAPVEGVNNNSAIAGRRVKTLSISWTWNKTAGAYKYNFSSWKDEDLGIPRVMGDTILLPNGDVVLLNGAQVGVAGDSATSGGNGGRANYPAFWAQLYQPDLPLDNRVSMLAASTIARMYHGVAVLTINATVLVAGCDRCFKLESDVPGYVSPRSRWEYRNEIFYPPYWFDTPNKPRIISVNAGNTRLTYNQDFVLTWGAEEGNGSVPVTSVSLVAPSSTTHSFNTNQRVVVLKVVQVNYNTNTIKLRSPPHPFVAPPQWYMIFAMNGKTMSRGKWVKLVDSRGEGKVVPK